MTDLDAAGRAAQLAVNVPRSSMEQRGGPEPLIGGNDVLPGGRTALILLMLVSMFNYVDRTILSILQEPVKADLGLSDTQLGLLTGLAFALLYATLSLPIARLADRFNRRNIITAALATWSGMTMLCGAAGSFLSLFIFRVGVAVGEAGSVPASHSIIADYFPPARRATALATWGLALPAGLMFGYAAGGWIATALGWRLAFAVIGGTGLLLAPIFLWMVREPQRRFGKVQLPADAAETVPMREALAILWRLRTYRYMLAGATLHAFAQYALMNWTAPFYLRVHELSLAQVASMLALVNGLGGGIGIYLGGWLSDRLGARRPAARVWLSAVAMLLMVPFTLGQLLAGSTTISIALAFASTTLMFFYYGPIVAVPQSLVAPRMRALTSAVTLLVFNLFGLGLGPLVVGMLSDALAPMLALPETSLRYALAASLLFSALGGLLVLAASRHYRAEVLEE
jgi:predicted MFS family arabinose efflux permease